MDIRSENEKKNIKLLKRNGFPFRYVNNATVAIRVNGLPKIDYYVSKNKWKASEGKTVRYHQSSPEGFINWYKKKYKDYLKTKR